MNSVVVIGRVGHDPELKFFESGKSRASFSVAANRWDPKTQSEVTDWFNVDVWDRTAQFVGDYVKKGTLVAIEGRIASSKWKDQTGEERERFLIVANNVRLPGSRKDDGQ